MRPSSARDWVNATLLALGLHLALVLIVLLGYWLQQFWPAASAPPGAISAELVDGDELSSAMQRTLRNRPEPEVEEPPPEPVPEPLPEPVEEQPEPQDFIPEPDEIDQVEVTEQPTPIAADEDDKVQEAKQRQAQVDLTEAQRQQQRQATLTEMERQRQLQLEDIRKRRAAAAREADLAEQRLQQLAEARSRDAATAAAQSDAAASGAGGDDDLRGRYVAAIAAAVRSKWNRPPTVAPGMQCRLTIIQLRGGRVLSAQVGNPCDLDEEGRRSIEAAVLKAQPLPFAGFESVFNRELNFRFEADDR